MKVLTLEDLTHLASGNTNWAVCWKLTDTFGNVARQTSHDRDIEVTRAGLEGTYTSLAALQTSQLRATDDGAVDNLDVDALLTEFGLTEDAIRAGMLDQMRFVIFLVNWKAPTNSGVIVKSGVVGNIRTFARGLAQAEGRGLKQFLQQTVMETYGLGCRYQLGDERCTVDLAPFTFSATVTSVQSARLGFTAASLTQGAGYFTGGVLTFTSGGNETFSREVKRHQSGGVLEVFEPWPRDVMVGDTFSVHAGCDHLHQVVDGTVLGDCGPKFDNVINYGGFPFIPGNNEIMRGVK